MTTAPNLGFRILYPTLKYRFQVSFLDTKKKVLPYSSDLTPQVVSVSPYSQMNDKAGESLPEFLYVQLEEDVSNFAAKAMQKLLLLDEFILRIETLDNNNNVIKTTDIEDAWVYKISHSDVDYAATSGPDKTVLRLKIPELMGSAINAIRDKSPEAEMIFQLLADSDLTLYTTESEVNSTVSPILVIGYNPGSVKVTFDKPNLKVV